MYLLFYQIKWENINGKATYNVITAVDWHLNFRFQQISKYFDFQTKVRHLSKNVIIYLTLHYIHLAIYMQPISLLLLVLCIYNWIYILHLFYVHVCAYYSNKCVPIAAINVCLLQLKCVPIAAINVCLLQH